MLCAIACSSQPQADHGWKAGPDLPTALFESYLATDGQKLVFLGGISGVTGDMSTATPSPRVLYLQPGTGTWTEGPPLPQDAPKHHLTVATIGPDIYVLGGFDGILGAAMPFTPIAKGYVLRDGAWKSIATQPLARGAATAQAIGGKIYVTGGATTEGVQPFGDTLEYDPAADSWQKRASLPTPREHLASCVLDDKMIAVGGWAGPERVAQTAVEMYDPATDSWTTLPGLPIARGGLASVALGGACLALGGEDWKLPYPGTFDNVESLHLGDAAWTELSPMPKPRHGIGVAVLNGVLYVAGGGPGQGNSYTTEVDIFTP